jgi:excisionase family DNA binding protein
MTTETNQKPELKFYTVKEVASHMRVSKMTVYRLLNSNELPSVRVGNSFRVPEIAVERYIKKNTTVEF